MFNIFNKKVDYQFIEKDGHKIAFRDYGNKNAPAIISFHGGPGSSSKEKHAEIFNLKKNRVIIFDQRGCGKSEYEDLLKNNTTDSILSDAKSILEFLGIKKVVSYGGSWGSTLALLFAQKYPSMVKKIGVCSIFLARKEDVNWIYEEMGNLYPDLIEQIKAPLKNDELLKFYYDKLFSGDDEDVKLSTRLFGSYERLMGDLEPKLSTDYEPTEDHIKNYKIYMHYMYNNFFIEENQILKNMCKIKDIPMIILHNRLDLICTVKSAFLLDKASKNSKLFIIPASGHGGPELYKKNEEENKFFYEEIAYEK